MMRSTYGSLGAAFLAGSLGLGLSTAAVAQDDPEEKKSSWADNISIGAFVDAYGAIRSDNNEYRFDVLGNGEPVNAAYGHEAYVLGSGFGLAFAGADLEYSGEQFGATISLRFGPGVTRFYGGAPTMLGIENITQAYLTWKPFKDLTLDMGQFGTLYGAEVAESWRNLNYSRGALYFLMQPFWHMGVRANYTLNDYLAFNAMIVNGVNNAFEDNKSPTLGVQVVATPIESLSLAVGYMGALNPRDGGNGDFHNFFDFVATYEAGGFSLVANVDVNDYRPQGASDRENWWGVSIAPGYAFTNWFGAALRGEFLSASTNIFGMATPPSQTPWLATMTATLDFKPVPNSAALVLRPEFRYEVARDDLYLNRDNNPTDKFWTVMLGAVVTSM